MEKIVIYLIDPDEAVAIYKLLQNLWHKHEMQLQFAAYADYVEIISSDEVSSAIMLKLAPCKSKINRIKID